MFVRVIMKYLDNVFEGYLDAEEKFYDYRTAEISGDRIFDERTTGVSFYNQFLNAKDSEYLRSKKNLRGEVVLMSPEEYYVECGKHGFGHPVSPESLKSQRASDKSTIEHLKQVLTVYKKRFPMPFINYAENGQEGLHRMYVAGELLGWDAPKHPVLCIYWADEERHERDLKEKQRAEVESAIESAVKDSLRYKYAEIAEFEEQLQYDLDRRFEYFNQIDKPVKFSMSVDDDVISVTVADVTYRFDKDSIQILESPKDDIDELELDLDDIDFDLDTDEFIKKYLN